MLAAGDSTVQMLSRYAIREAIYVGRLNAAAKVRPAGGKWELIGGYPEFAGVFRMMGGDLAPMAGTRKLAGWRRSGGERTDPLRSVVRDRPELAELAREVGVPEMRRETTLRGSLPPSETPRFVPEPDAEPTTEAAPRPSVAPAPLAPSPAPARPEVRAAAAPAPSGRSGGTTVLIVVGGLVAVALLGFLIFG